MIEEYDIYEERRDFSLTPEIGALAKFGNFSNWGALVSLGYKWTTNKIEFCEKTYNQTSYSKLHQIVSLFCKIK